MLYNIFYVEILWNKFHIKMRGRGGGRWEGCYIIFILHLAFINLCVPVPPTFWVPVTPLIWTSIEKRKSNKAAEEGNFALPNISAKVTIIYYLMPNILECIFIYIYSAAFSYSVICSPPIFYLWSTNLIGEH